MHNASFGNVLETWKRVVKNAAGIGQDLILKFIFVFTFKSFTIKNESF